MSYAVSRYKQSTVATGSPKDVLVALLEGAANRCMEAAAHLRTRHWAEKGQSVNRVLAILAELASTLDDARAPELCRDLRALYASWSVHLARAASTNRPDDIERVGRALREMAGTWAAVKTGEGAGEAAP